VSRGDTTGTARHRAGTTEKEARLTALGSGYIEEQWVASLSRALGDFSVEIAKVIGETVQHRIPRSGAGQRLRRAPAYRRNRPRTLAD